MSLSISLECWATSSLSEPAVSRNAIDTGDADDWQFVTTIHDKGNVLMRAFLVTLLSGKKYTEATFGL